MSARSAVWACAVAGVLLVQAGAACAASLRATSVITGDNVRLSDLFSGLDPGQDKVLGPAPPPGGSIQVGGRQLIAIADQYDVDWVDQSPSALATIKRAGRVLDRDYFVDLVQKQLPDSEDGPVSVEVTEFHPLTVAPNDPAPVVLSDMNWDRRTGRFTATVYRATPTGDVTQDSFLLKGVVRAAHKVLVFSRTLAMGAVLSPNDVQINDSYTGHTAAGTVADAGDVAGMTLLHSVLAGDVVMARDLQRTIVMHKGDPVLIVFAVPGVHLTATGRALEDGGMGQYVRAINASSGMVATGRVTSASELSVEPGSHAVQSDPNTLRRLSAANRADARASMSLR